MQKAWHGMHDYLDLQDGRRSCLFSYIQFIRRAHTLGNQMKTIRSGSSASSSGTTYELNFLIRFGSSVRWTDAADSSTLTRQ